MATIKWMIPKSWWNEPDCFIKHCPTNKMDNFQGSKKWSLNNHLDLEPWTSTLKWLEMVNQPFFHVKIWNHPTETTVYKWMLQVPWTHISQEMIGYIPNIWQKIAHLPLANGPPDLFLSSSEPRPSVKNIACQQITVPLGSNKHRLRKSVWTRLRKEKFHDMFQDLISEFMICFKLSW